MPVPAAQTSPREALGEAMHRFIAELFPVCRSITGDGLRHTLRAVQARLASAGAPLTLHEVPTGTPVLDWTIPKEWTIRDAFIKDGRGRRVVDFQVSNLHVVQYSTAVHEHLSLDALRPHLHTLPEHPGWIPYRTSYYHETWGFCLSHRQYERLAEDTYEVCIDADLQAGSLSYGELVLPGATDEEVLISCHVCHPSLANDNLSGLALTTFLAQALAERPVRHRTYRFLLAPGTIGALAWLARNEEATRRIAGGLVVACAGDAGALHYKRSRRGNALIDRAAEHVLKHHGAPYRVRDFTPYGYDERQYNSPGFNLPIGSLTRTPHGQYPEYHTSADDLTLVRPGALADTLKVYLDVIDVLEHDRRYLSTNPKGEPQLGRRGLYRTLGGHPDTAERQMALLWVLNLADGARSLLDIAERSGLPFAQVRDAALLLREHELLVPLSP